MHRVEQDNKLHNWPVITIGQFPFLRALTTLEYLVVLWEIRNLHLAPSKLSAPGPYVRTMPVKTV